MTDEHKFKKEQGVLVNHDDINYTRYIQQRNRLKAAKLESTDMKNKVSKLEDELSDIKSLLQQLLNK